LLIDEARRRGVRSVVAFAAATSQYHLPVRRAPWHETAVERILLVSIAEADYYLVTAAAAGEHLAARPGTAAPEAFCGPDDALAWLDAERASLIVAVSLAAAMLDRFRLLVRPDTVLRSLVDLFFEGCLGRRSCCCLQSAVTHL
jgi:hypothetical protein